MSDIVVKFKPQGQKALIQAIKQLEKAKAGYVGMTKKANVTVAQMTSKLAAQDLTWKKLGVDIKVVTAAARGNRLAMDKLQLAIKRGTKANHGLLTSNRLLDHSFATMRSHLLLFNFAMGLGIRQVINFTKEAAKVDQMETAFNTLAGGGEKASIAVDKLKEATNGTLSEFDLFQQANNAMILGVTKNSDEMSEMFDMAQRLGAALGRDTASSVESLVTGIGRQSRLMLDNIGIVVKSEEAYEDYAKELKKNVNNLTDAEKKQAFMNATLDAAREKLQNLPEEVLTTDQKFQALAAAFDDASVAIGEGFLPIVEPLTTALTAIAEGITPERVKALGTVISVSLVGAMILYRKQLEAVILRQTMLGWGALATAAGFLAAEVLVMSGIFDDAEDNIENFNTTASNTSIILDKLNKNFVAVTPTQEMLDMQDLLTKEYKKTEEAQILLLKAQIEYANKLKDENKLNPEQIKGLDRLIEKLDELQKKKEDGTDILEKEIQLNKQLLQSSFQVGQGYKNAGDAAVAAAKASIAAKIQEAVMTYMAEAMTKIPYPLSLGVPALGAAMAGALGSVLSGSSSNVSNSVGAGSIGQFEQGGLVGGRRHSQGGTIIEAERGEFVMSRNAVESIGLETLNQMNQSGGGASINVSVTGNVLTQDFVEGELAESIKEAVRRGSDFGIG